MIIWAFNEPGEVEFVRDSVRDGKSRFGWSYFDAANLLILKEKNWHEMNEDEKECWRKSSFLLDIKKGDWIVHINVPKWGHCSAAKVVDRYSFENKDTPVKDFRHVIMIDKESLLEFNRNDHNILPIVNRKLKLRGRYWRIRCEKEFFESLENLRENKINLGDGSHGVHYLKRDLSQPLKEITKLIHKNHFGKNLEWFLAEVFRKMPNVVDVKVNGSGWGTDHGADLIIKYQSGLPLGGLEKEETLVVQVKSYAGEHWEINAVDQIKTAIEEYDADSGMLITTAEKTEKLEESIDSLAKKSGKSIALLAGADVARFVMRYYGQELLI